MRQRFILAALLFTAQSGVAQSGTGIATPCFASVDEAARQEGMVVAQTTGYRLQSRRWDPFLNRGWAMVASCEHPERPEVAVPLAQSPNSLKGAIADATPPAVRAGDIVHVRYYGPMVHLELSAVAQSSGYPGDTIRARVNQGGQGSGGTERYVSAVVVGPRTLEIQP
ncbi:flagella basal body P-ring formation protein FlgA [Granulicella sp. WH15]|uniref:flagella basal body P-ring formation protein FlgA n=1 Tax=Granulicella sp. WH15 TaxID=2602070 RepID=UPI0013A5B003|nr:flagella basal body P-ring formation protein FlgA [Granulicella sp. WH15]